MHQRGHHDAAGLVAHQQQIRINVLHPGIVEDDPFWHGKTEALTGHRARTTTGRLVRMQDIVEVAVMMLENPSIAGTEFWVDSGWSLPL